MDTPAFFQRDPAEGTRPLRSTLLRGVIAAMADTHHLTAAEARILPELCAGLENAGIARAHGISPSTVNVHVRSILQKFGVSSRRDLTREFVRNIDQVAEGIAQPVPT